MESLEKNTFYSPSEKLVFWVAGYLSEDSFPTLEFTKLLNERVTQFSEFAQVDPATVHSFINNSPPRYQYMRVFYAQTEQCPQRATVLSDSWTMQKLLS